MNCFIFYKHATFTQNFWESIMRYAVHYLKILVLLVVLIPHSVYGSKRSLTNESLVSSSMHCAFSSSEVSWRAGIFAAFMIASLSIPTVISRARGVFIRDYGY